LETGLRPEPVLETVSLTQTYDTVVMPIHNDDNVLPYSLNCLRKFQGEIIFVLDDPSPKSRKYAEAFSKLHPNVIILNKGKLPFKVDNHVWHSYLYGSLFATGERIFWIGADVVFSSEIFRKSIPLPCKFEYIDADNHFMFTWFKILSRITRHHCVEVFPRDFPFYEYAWRSEEKLYQKPTRQIPFHKVNQPTVLHLRRNRNSLRHFVQGRRRKKLETPFLRILLHSILFMKPLVLLGYIYETFKHKPDPDAWEINRIDERLCFALDIGSGKNKICGLGCDIRKVTDVQCDARLLPFRDKSFVIAVFRHSLEHIKNWKQPLKEAQRVAEEVFVILPKKNIWKSDPEHVSFFSLGIKPIKTFAYGECYKIDSETTCIS